MADVTTPGGPATGTPGAGNGHASDVGAQAQQASGDATSTAQDAAGQAKEKAQEAADQAREKAQQATQKARGRVREQVDQRSTEAGEQVASTASDLRSVGEELRKQGKDTPAKLADQAAERSERVGGYLRDADADRILGDVEDFARRQPWAVVAGGMALGFAASRFLKASSSERYASRQASRSPSSLHDGGAPTTTVSAGPAVPRTAGAVPPPAYPPTQPMAPPPPAAPPAAGPPPVPGPATGFPS